MPPSDDKVAAAATPVTADPGQTRTEVGRTLPATPAGVAAAAAGPLPVAGKRLAHFRLERPLGKGGMGEVWLATDLALDRPVAIKLLGRDLSDAPSVRERFYREARAQARITHANVGHIYFIGEQDGQLFFAMELIEGESLADRLKREGKLSAAEALELCRQAALGLREAHHHGFTHRDVKPSNLMLDRHGQVKLVDFGLVKPQRDVDVQLTADNAAVLGTPLYMAPEQARGDAVDHRADIYALGATLHHLITGKPPFEGQTPMALVSKHLTEARPRLPEPRRLPTGLDALIDRMMAKEPAARFASYDDLLAALEQTVAEENAAGFWVRATAALVDFMFIGIVAAALTFLFTQVGGEVVIGNLLLWVFLPPYAMVATTRFGKSVGKLLFDLEVVSEQRQGRPSFRQALIRMLVQLGPVLVGVGLLELEDLLSGGLTRAVLIVIGIALFLAPLWVGLAVVRRRDRRALWDLAAGTRVRYARRRRGVTARTDR